MLLEVLFFILLIMIVQNNDWLTQLNLTILDNVQQPLVNSSLTDEMNQAGKNQFDHVIISYTSIKCFFC